MRIAIGADHAGFQVKENLKQHVTSLGHAVTDVGASGEESCDYPDFAQKVARAVSRGECDCGVLVCGTGIGMSIVANKVPGVRAAVCHNALSAEFSRRHNDANVFCTGSRIVSVEEARSLLDVWLQTPFEGGRHERRVQKIAFLDAEHGTAASPSPD